MKIDILTLFPEMFEPLKCSILGRAQQNNLIEINLTNIRDFSTDKHKKVDDTPFGGGAGMVMMCQPLFDAINSVKTEGAKIIYMSPKGETLNQKMVVNLSKVEHLVIVCGHYEGIDERVIQHFDMQEISIGDYVLTGGELPAMVLVDSVSRYIDGVLSVGSTSEESFSNGLLEYPQYTKPRVYAGLEVPEVLVGGNHQEIAKWKLEQSLKITKERRPDLLKGKK
ncbi:MAG TPA: tRNA (guanosine(37)-N1)-methyltransferase TrmD [Clostridiales bacterium]|nr:tRNA (guanosine(37)-N1)-methyltransferase TrmD [Clostridiales bacterium]